MTVWVASPEDTVLSKLEWPAMSGSDRQLRDASAVIAVVGDALDHVYMEDWAGVIGVGDLLERARDGG